MNNMPVSHAFCLLFAGVMEEKKISVDIVKRAEKPTMEEVEVDDDLDLVHMESMLLLWSGKDQNVIQIYKHKMVDIVSQNIFDQILENGWVIGEPKEHDQLFKTP